MADQQLPHNDPDRQLARSIDRARMENKSLSELDHPLISQLLEFRLQSHRSYQAERSDKLKVWQSIEAATKKSSQKTFVTTLVSARTIRWAAAALLLIGALFSFIYFQLGHQPELLAQSTTSIKTVQLNDGSTATLRPHSKLFAVEKSSSALLFELQGEARFEVTPKQNRTFSVQTETGRVSVLGTRFMLSSWGGRTQVFLEEGSVEIKALKKDSTVVLEPGESASITSESDISLVSAANAEEFTDWLNQELIFDNRSAGQITSELKQQFDISISLPDNITENRLSGRLSLKNLQTSLDDLALVLGGTFIQTGERSYKFEPN